MIKYTLYIGLNDKDEKTQIIDTKEAYKIIYNIMFKNNIEGFTTYDAYGVYKHNNGEIVEEKTIKIEIIYVEDDTIQKVIKEIKEALNQESILVQVEKIESDFK